jgi:hypothetical protein
MKFYEDSFNRNKDIMHLDDVNIFILFLAEEANKPSHMVDINLKYRI